MRKATDSIKKTILRLIGPSTKGAAVSVSTASISMWVLLWNITEHTWTLSHNVQWNYSRIKKTAFSTPFGLYCFVTLPFGLFWSPVMFQYLMNRILHPHNAYTTAYVDDIVIYSNDLQWHLQHLSQQELSWGPWDGWNSQQTQRSVQLDSWKYNTWASTWAIGRCIPKLIRQGWLRPAWDARPKRGLGSSWNWLAFRSFFLSGG